MRTAGPSWTYRRLREGEQAPLVQLLTAAFGTWPTLDIGIEPLAHLEWKHASGPGTPRVHPVAEADGRLVACHLSWVQPVKLRERVLEARQGVDVAAHPDFAERGIMTGLLQFVLDELRSVYDLRLRTLSGHPALARRWRGDERIGRFRPIDVLVHPLSPSVPTVGRGPTGWTVREASRFDGRIDGFWEEASKPFDFSVARTSEYLNWRYCDARAGDFTIKVAEQEGHVLGYTVACVRRGKGYVADLLTLPGRDDVAGSLLDEALAYLRRAGASGAQSWCPANHPNAPALRSHGFQLKRRYKRLAYQALRVPDAELRFLSDARTAVHVALGDTDWV